MANTDFESVDQYIATHPKDVQAVLPRARAIIRKAMPRAEEAISYQIAAFKLHGRVVIFLAGWKQHYSALRGGDALSQPCTGLHDGGRAFSNRKSDGNASSRRDAPRPARPSSE